MALPVSPLTTTNCNEDRNNTNQRTKKSDGGIALSDFFYILQV